MFLVLPGTWNAFGNLSAQVEANDIAFKLVQPGCEQRGVADQTKYIQCSLLNSVRIGISDENTTQRSLLISYGAGLRWLVRW